MSPDASKPPARRRTIALAVVIALVATAAGTVAVDAEDDAPSHLALANVTFRTDDGYTIRVTDRYDAIC